MKHPLFWWRKKGDQRKNFVWDNRRISKGKTRPNPLFHIGKKNREQKNWWPQKRKEILEPHGARKKGLNTKRGRVHRPNEESKEPNCFSKNSELKPLTKGERKMKFPERKGGSKINSKEESHIFLPTLKGTECQRPKATDAVGLKPSYL